MSASGEKRRAADGGRNDWQTPPDLFIPLNREFRFMVDGAASSKNTLCAKYYSEEFDAFFADPIGQRIWINPPYGGLKRWADLIVEWSERNLVVALVPAAPDTMWWRTMYDAATEVRLLSGRVKFINPDTGLPDGSNTTGSTIFVFDHDSPRPRTCFLWDWKNG